MYYMIQEESENADNWIEYEKYLTLTKLLNQPKFSDEIYEFKRYCINTPEILDWLEQTKEELSSIFGIVDESSDDKLENVLAELVKDPSCECGNAIGIFAEARYKNAVLDKARAEGYKLELDDWQDLISYSKGD